MRYGQAFTFFVNKPKTGWLNILFGLICQFFIPIIGPIVWLGYRADTAADLEDDPEMKYHRDFDFSEFGEYLKRGIWPFLIQLVFGGVAAMLGVAIVLGGLMAAGGESELALVAMLGGYLIIMLLIFLATTIMWPMELYAALSQEFRIGGAFAFTSRFMAVMWKQTLITVFVYFILATVVGILGMLACCIGIYPAGVIISMAEHHLMVQLYRQYVDLGGVPIRSLDNELALEEDE